MKRNFNSGEEMYSSFKEVSATIALHLFGINKATVCKKIEAALRADTGEKVWRCDLLRPERLRDFVSLPYVTMEIAALRTCFPKTLATLRTLQKETPNEAPTNLPPLPKAE